MKLDKLDSILAFSLLFNDTLLRGSRGCDHSPDYIMEKFNTSFSIDINNVIPIDINSIGVIGVRDYFDKWGIDENGIVVNIIVWLIVNSQSDDIVSTIKNFEKYVCDYKHIHLTDRFMILHPVLITAIEKIIDSLNENTHYIKTKRLLTLKEII